MPLLLMEFVAVTDKKRTAGSSLTSHIIEEDAQPCSPVAAYAMSKIRSMLHKPYIIRTAGVLARCFDVNLAVASSQLLIM